MSVYTKGINRLIYKASSLVSNLTVSAYFYNPDGIKTDPYQFTDLESGLYYLDFNFDQYGTWSCIISEEGEKKQSGVFKVLPPTAFSNNFVVFNT